MSLNDEVQRGQWATQILENSLWQEAIAHIDASLLEKMREHHSDPRACQEIALTKKVADLIFAFFADVRDTGKLAQIQLNTEREAEERKTRLRAIPGA